MAKSYAETNHGMHMESLRLTLDDDLEDHEELMEEGIFQTHLVRVQIDAWYRTAAVACVFEEWDIARMALRYSAECGEVLWRGANSLGQKIEVEYAGHIWPIQFDELLNKHASEYWLISAEAAVIVGVEAKSLFAARQEHFRPDDLSFKGQLRGLVRAFSRGELISDDELMECESTIDEWIAELHRLGGREKRRFITRVELDRAIARLVHAASADALNDEIVRSVVEFYPKLGAFVPGDAEYLVAFPVLMVLARTDWRPSFVSPYLPLQVLGGDQPHAEATPREPNRGDGPLPESHPPSQEACSQFLFHEQALRDLHGDEHLYVRPKAYQRPDASVVLVGGWVYADGNPAIIPPADIVLLVETDGQSKPFEHDVVIEAFKQAGARVEIHFLPCTHAAIWAEDMTPLQIAKLWGYLASRMA